MLVHQLILLSLIVLLYFPLNRAAISSFSFKRLNKKQPDSEKTEKKHVGFNPFRRKNEVATVAVKIPPPSSISSINILMLLFYGTLGSVMPYLPVFYRNLGVSGENCF
jgi:hypothetical protein